MHKQFSEKGLVVLGFASNDFKQEARDEAKAAEICYVNYGVTFTMLAPSSVKGQEANPIFQEINKQSEEPDWNFNKYLIDKNGTVIQHFGKFTSPNSPKVIRAIKSIL